MYFIIFKFTLFRKNANFVVYMYFAYLMMTTSIRNLTMYYNLINDSTTTEKNLPSAKSYE